MARIQRVCSAMVTAMLLTACGQADETKQPEPPAVKDTAFGDMVGTMEKARGVESTLQQDKATLDRALEHSEGANEQSDDQ